MARDESTPTPEVAPAAMSHANYRPVPEAKSSTRFPFSGGIMS